ncbi:putative transcription factor MYB-HB-like family [Helianthus annuus]|nr:putative transcription factor MYB-HB-like family [Helianthus annuus]
MANRVMNLQGGLIMSQPQSESQSDAGEIMLFGVRVKVDPMRKSVSMNNLSQYESPNNNNNSNLLGASATVAAAAANTGYASADDVVRRQSNGSRERKRGIPWTEEEHKLFLQGLQKVGKGDWRGISRNFVKTRTPTQVASHAQKYFLRRSNLNRRRRRSSLFDITTDSVAIAMQTQEQGNENNKVQVVVQPSMPPPIQCQNSVNGGSRQIVHPITAVPPANPSTRMDLNLSLTYNPNRSSSYQVMSGFNNGDSMISVN